MGKLNGHLTVAAVGKVKDGAWRTAQEDYLGRLRRYTDVRLAEVKDDPRAAEGDAAAKVREGGRLLEAAEGCRVRVALTPEGRAVTSPELARRLERWVSVHGRVAFLIGGPAGLAPETLAACEERLSLSPLTFPHEMARVVLLEQLYRACTLLNGEKYHR